MRSTGRVLQIEVSEPMMFVRQEVLVHEVASQLLLRHFFFFFFFFFFKEQGVSAEEENKITPIITNR
jgi:hypothetical protein